MVFTFLMWHHLGSLLVGSFWTFSGFLLHKNLFLAAFKLFRTVPRQNVPPSCLNHWSAFTLIISPVYVGYYMTEVVCHQPLQKKKPVPPLVYVCLWCRANPCTMKSSRVWCMLFLILKTPTMTIWSAFQLPHCLRPKIAGINSERRISRRFPHFIFSHAL